MLRNATLRSSVLLLSKRSLWTVHCVWSCSCSNISSFSFSTTTLLALSLNYRCSLSASEPLKHFPSSVLSESLHPFFLCFKSPSRPPTPSYSFPSSLLFSWSLHSTPPLQTAHKRAESATPDLWQTFQSSRPFHTARVLYRSSSISQSLPLVQ